MMTEITATTPVWTTLLGVTQGWATVEQMLQVAKTHRNGYKMVDEAVAWGIIDSATRRDWIYDMEALPDLVDMGGMYLLPK